MAIQEAVVSITLPAGANLTTHQYKFVTVNDAGKVVLSGNNATAYGILLNAPNTDEAATVAVPGSGILKVKCGANVTRGGTVGSDANGAAKNTATASAVLGIALETGANGRVISILFQPRS
jgi:hypothetical protein